MSDIKDKRLGCFYSGLSETEYFYDGTFYVGLCSKGFPYCLPSTAEDNLEAVYLGNTEVSETGVVYDESGNSNDAQLVNSNCLNSDGIVYGQIQSKLGVTATKIDDATYLNLCFVTELNNLKIGSFINTAILADGTSPVNPTFAINHTNGRIYWSLFGVQGDINIAAYNDGEIHVVELKYNGTNVQLIIDNNVLQTVVGTPTFTEYTYTQFNKYKFGTRQGKLVRVFLENQDGKIFDVGFAEGNGPYTYDDISGEEIAYFNPTLPILYTVQDKYHRNFINGFDLYENGTAGEEIRVPIGASVTQAGYTLTSSNPAGKWHNGAETEIDLDDTLKAVIDGDITDPLGYSEWMTNFNASDIAFSNMKENEHKNLVFYSSPLSLAEKLQVQKCLDVKNSEFVMVDEDDVVMVDEDGIILVDE